MGYLHMEWFGWYVSPAESVVLICTSGSVAFSWIFFCGYESSIVPESGMFVIGLIQKVNESATISTTNQISRISERKLVQALTVMGICCLAIVLSDSELHILHLWTKQST